MAQRRGVHKPGRVHYDFSVLLGLFIGCIVIPFLMYVH